MTRGARWLSLLRMNVVDAPGGASLDVRLHLQAARDPGPGPLAFIVELLDFFDLHGLLLVIIRNQCVKPIFARPSSSRSGSPGDLSRLAVTPHVTAAKRGAHTAA